MSFIKIGNNNFEYVTVALRPQTSFLSSSAGVTGSNFVSPFRSSTLKRDFPNLSLDNIDPNDKQEIADIMSKISSSPDVKRRIFRRA